MSATEMINLKDNPAFTITAAIVTRVILLCHTLLVVWNVYTDKADDNWWLLLLFVLPMIIELAIVICRNRGHEWNSAFSPSIFLYLVSVLPSIWILEVEEINHIKNNMTDLTKSFSLYLYGQSQEPSLVITLSSNVWLMAMEQSMVFLLIFARWCLPCGHMSYSQLSNILLLYIGTLADILELLEMFQLDGALENWDFVYAVITVFSLGLLQFTLIIVEKPPGEESQKLLPPENKSDSEDDGWRFMPKHVRWEVATILQSVILMHLPVVAIRIYAIVIYGIKLYSNIFFLIKNCLMLIINVNRLIILCFLSKPK